MNVYDFDGTIYDGDSTIDFYLYCLKTDLHLVKYIPKQAYGMLLYGIKKIDKTMMKEKFFCFLYGVPDVTQKVNLFWKIHDKNINRWYIKQSESSDIVISASPSFLLKPICNKLQISELIASDIDITTGHFYNANCRGEEKVKRFLALHPDEEIDKFYSDSVSDIHMANIAKHAFLVKKGTIRPWNNQ